MLIKFNLSTKILIINFFYFFLKIPLSTQAFRSVRNEIKVYRKLINNAYFNSKNFGIFNIYPFFFGFFIPRGTQISQFDKKFIKQYVDFYKVFNLKKKASETLNLTNLELFIKEHNNENYHRYKDYLQSKEILVTPVHGDLYYKNVVIYKNKYYLIDLNFYSEDATYYFDLINYKIFSSKYYKDNWFSLFKNHQKKFYKIINKDYLIMYLLWKVNNDLKYIKKNEFKNNKYKDILKYFFNNLI
tara:strand:- start:2273 stop:3001 length:729 start_codon:yes stop_codon:yes gene_type:complete